MSKNQISETGLKHLFSTRDPLNQQIYISKDNKFYIKTKRSSIQSISTEIAMIIAYRHIGSTGVGWPKKMVKDSYGRTKIEFTISREEQQNRCKKLLNILN